MKSYRLTIYHHDQLLGHFESDLPWSLTAVSKVAGNLNPVDGYRLELFQADEEKRLLESGPDGIKVLAREPIFKAIPLSNLNK